MNDIENTDRYREYLKTDKWKNIAAQRIRIDGYMCQGCGSRGTQNNRLECHHLSYKHLYHEENWIYQDLVTLCGNCHRTTHAIMCRITDPSGRRGWKDNIHIPQISVYTLTGEDMQSREVGYI